MPDEIIYVSNVIVVANLGMIPSGVLVMNAPLGSGGPAGGTNMGAIIAQNKASSDKVVSFDADASDADIIVIANSVRRTAFNMMTVATADVIVNSLCMPLLGGM